MFFNSRIYSFVCEPRVSKYGIQFHIGEIYIKKLTLNLANCDVSMASCSNLVTNKPKIRPCTLSFGLKFDKGANF